MCGMPRAAPSEEGSFPPEYKTFALMPISYPECTPVPVNRRDLPEVVILDRSAPLSAPPHFDMDCSSSRSVEQTEMTAVMAASSN
jgi:hypothetical protein